MTLEESYYVNQLKEQLSLLINACHMYDNEYFSQAKIMSGIIRTLVKDPPSGRKSQTVSLLTSLNIKNKMKFYNTGYDAVDPLLSINLVGFVTIPAPVLYSKPTKQNIYVPLFNNSSLIDVKWIDFESWWNSNVIVSKTENSCIELSRKKIVLTMAEQDGGVHVDRYENIDSVYRDIITHTTDIFTNINSTGVESPIEYLQYALVRQISHELLVSISRVFNLPHPYTPTLSKILHGTPKENIIQPSVLATNGGHLSKRTNNPTKGGDFQSIKPPANAAYMRLIYKIS